MRRVRVKRRGASPCERPGRPKLSPSGRPAPGRMMVASRLSPGPPGNATFLPLSPQGRGWPRSGRVRERGESAGFATATPSPTCSIVGVPTATMEREMALQVDEIEIGEIDVGALPQSPIPRMGFTMTFTMSDEHLRPRVMIRTSVPLDVARPQTWPEILGAAAYRAHQVLRSAAALSRDQLAELLAKQMEPLEPTP